MADQIEKLASLAQDQLDKEAASDPAIRKVMKIVENFLKTHRVMCYGGTAINNLLPKQDQFQDPERDIPDQDFFSETPQEHAMELSDQLVRAGVASVEAKPGVHLGTFKVFADFTGVADITHLDSRIFNKLWKEKETKEGIHQVPPNYLRMSVYLELSRPRGDVSRWKKVFTRLQLLNKSYPISCPAKEEKVSEKILTPAMQSRIFGILKDNHAVLLGFNVSHTKEMKDWKFPLDVLATPENARKVAEAIGEAIGEEHSIRGKIHPAFEELIPKYYELREKKQPIVRVFETDACHSYHETGTGLWIASIPTLLHFFFAMLYAEEEFAPSNRLVCTAEQLMNLAHSESRRRFKILTPLTCIGKQKGLLDMRIEKSELQEKIGKDRSSPEFLEQFFSQNPKQTSPDKKKTLKKALKKL